TTASSYKLGDPGCPVVGAQFDGSCTTGGFWYTGTKFPAKYQNTYFHADFTQGWIQEFILDSNDNLLEIRPFATSIYYIVCMALNPVDGALYYINYGSDGGAVLRKIAYTSDGPPTSVASATPTYGQSPLTVHFSSDGSFDPEGKTLTYSW